MIKAVANTSPKYLNVVENSHKRGHIQTLYGNTIHKNLGYHYTSVGHSKLSLGKLATTSLKCFTLSAPTRKLGQVIQSGHDKHAPTPTGKALFWTGAMVKGLANITGGICGIAGGTVSIATSYVSNLAGTALRLIIGGWLGLKAVGLLSDRADQAAQAAGNAKIKAALDTATPSFIKKSHQQSLSQAGAQSVIDRAQLASISSSSRYRNLPAGFQVAQSNEIPSSVLARGSASNATGSELQLRHKVAVANNGASAESMPLLFSEEINPLLLTGDGWSDLKVGVFKDNTPSPNTKYLLSFVGTDLKKRPATLKSIVAQAFGIKDSAFQEASKLVKAFAQQYGKDNIEVIGHSLGGGLAQYAGIDNGVKVTAFNSMGLHVNLRDDLGSSKLNDANVTHVNSSGDSLSQGFEHGKFGLDASAQVGKRYVIDTQHNGGHRMQFILDGLVRTANGDGNAFDDVLNYSKKQDRIASG